MKTIHKYKLEINGTFSINMPIGAEILSIQEQSGHLYIWARVDPKRSTEVREFPTYGTGYITEAFNNELYIATVQMLNGLVWHVFEFVDS